MAEKLKNAQAEPGDLKNPGFLNGRVSEQTFARFTAAAGRQGYNRSEVLRLLVEAYVAGTIQIKNKDEDIVASPNRRI